MNTLVLILDLIGTFVFALSGATMGVRRRLDLFGVLVLSFAAASAGGMTRDVLIGATPVAALSDWRYPAISLTAGIVTFFWSPQIERLHNPVRMFDALGLAVFAVAGTQKALAFGLAPPMAAAMGMLTGIGGGIPATCCWRRCRWYCVPSCTPLPRWPARRLSPLATGCNGPPCPASWPVPGCASACA